MGAAQPPLRRLWRVVAPAAPPPQGVRRCGNDMGMPPVLAQVSFASSTAAARDEIVNDWAFNPGATDDASLAPITSALSTFYNAWTVQYGSHSVTWQAGVVKYYPLLTGAELAGGPHGSPVKTDLIVTSPSSGGSATDLPRGAALCLSLRDNAWMTAAVSGPPGAIPTGDFAQDEGAPATHAGNTRPRSSHAGRIYLGPFNASACTETAPNYGQVTPDLISKVGAAAVILMNVASIGWCVWSRRLAGIAPMAECVVGNEWAYQRLREIRSGVRTVFPK